MQADMNIKIKFREGFRPFAPSVLRERVQDYFELDCDSPYMLLVAPVKKERQIPMTEEHRKLWGIRAAERAPLGSPGHHAHRLFGPGADRRPGHQRELLRSDQGVRASSPAVRCWSTPRSTCGASRSSARRRMRTSASCGPTSIIWCWGNICWTRPSNLNGRKAPIGDRNSSSTEQGRGPQVRPHGRRRVPRARRAGSGGAGAAPRPTWPVWVASWSWRGCWCRRSLDRSTEPGWAWPICSRR